MKVSASISGLYVYPVKSLQGISLSRAVGLVSGIEHDRQWAIFTDDGTPLTQRKKPNMALIKPSIENNGLKLSAPEMGTISVATPKQDKEPIPVKVWKDHSFGQSAADDVNQWITEALKSDVPLRLLKAHQGHKREFIKPERFAVDSQYFSDAAPYLIANSASLEALNQKLHEQNLDEVDMRNFRANIVLSGLPAFSEHQYQYLPSSAHDFAFNLVDHCQRCIMITVNPDTGEYLPKATPFRSLTELNSMPDNTKAPAYGVNSTLDGVSSCQLEVGQKVELLTNKP